MATGDSDTWPVNGYWREHSSQHWYISFCLMMAAIQDHLTGLDLQRRGNLNWATTCHYYSLVHTARMLAFCVTGDFHTGHERLRAFFSSAFGVDRRPGNRCMLPAEESIRFNWLQSFVSGAGAASVAPDAFKEQADSTLGLNSKITQFAGMFDYLGELRTDANYESLLIAHEKHHRVVEEAFRELCDSAEQAGRFAADLATSIYQAHLERSALFALRRSDYRGMSESYVSGRLKICLTEKFGESGIVGERLEVLYARLRPNNAHATDHYEDISNAIQMEQFLPKTDLMEGFQGRIRAFTARVSRFPIERGSDDGNGR